MDGQRTYIADGKVLKLHEKEEVVSESGKVDGRRKNSVVVRDRLDVDQHALATLIGMPLMNNPTLRCRTT